MRKYFALAALMAVLGASAVSAEVKDFGIFKADILAGWTAEQDGNTVGIVKDDKTASMSVTVEENDGTSLADLADAFVKELNGENLTTDEDGNAVFEFTSSNGVKSRAVLNADEKNFALIVVTWGDNTEKGSLDEISTMIDSIQFKNI